MLTDHRAPDHLPSKVPEQDDVAAAAPKVTVLMAVHNGGAYLEPALRSIMDQTLREIEILVIDDASSDGSPEVLRRLVADDPRIRVETLSQNRGLAAALNIGLGLARAPYVARMDADDISLPERLAIQKRFLDLHPEVFLVGSSIEWIDGVGRVIRRSVRPRDTFEVAWLARFMLTIIHPTFMFRAQLPDGSAPRYDPNRSVAQDHEFICRLIGSVDIACLPEVLLRYRRHDKAVSVTRAQLQRANAREICMDYQARHLPVEIVNGLEPLSACYFDGAHADQARIAALFAGARSMLAHDIAANPDRRHWLRRQTAQLVAWSLRRRRTSAGRIAQGFLRHGPDLLVPLALRALETKRLLPPWLLTDSKVWKTDPNNDPFEK